MDAQHPQNQQPINIHVNGDNRGTLKKSWPIALGLSIVLGGFGIDRFYLGNVGVGLLKMFTFGLFGILYILDIIMIATKNVRGIEWTD